MSRKYVVYIPEVYHVPHQVNATSEKEALSLAINGEAEPTGGDMFYIKTLDDINMYEIDYNSDIYHVDDSEDFIG